MPAWIHCINCLSLTLFIVACHKSNLKVSFEVQFIVVPQVVEIKKKKKKRAPECQLQGNLWESGSS